MLEALRLQEGEEQGPGESEAGAGFLRMRGISESIEGRRGHPWPRRQEQEWKNTSMIRAQKVVWVV